MRSVINLPRQTRPELVEVGDTIVVTIRAERGVTVRYEGTVDACQHHGGSVHWVTAEGAVIARYRPGEAQPGVQYTLMSRAPAAQEPLSLFEQVAERIA